MKWSWKLGRIAGIDLYVHATFLLIILWVAWMYWSQGQSLAATLMGVLFVLAIFVCVVLHEFGHALTARRFGVKTRDITLLPIGGLARLERIPDEPVQEFLVAVAGPAVNVVIAAVIGAWLFLAGNAAALLNANLAASSFLERLLFVNLFIAVFNMLPAFPMDGGRVLRALLATQMEYVRATQIASTIGQAMALLFGFVGLFNSPILLFIALFVWIGAAQEASMVQMRTALGGIPVSQGMMTDFRTLAPHDPLTAAVDLTLSGAQRDFPVVEADRVTGVLMQSDLFAALAKADQHRLVSEVMQTDFQAVDASEMLEPALQRLQECDCRTLPVLRNGRLVGLLTMENIGEFLRIQAALGDVLRTRAAARPRADAHMHEV